MSTWSIIAIVVISFVAMEGVAWATHKYVMHGFLGEGASAFGAHARHQQRPVSFLAIDLQLFPAVDRL